MFEESLPESPVVAAFLQIDQTKSQQSQESILTCTILNLALLLTKHIAEVRLASRFHIYDKHLSLSDFHILSSIDGRCHMIGFSASMELLLLQGLNAFA
jgi:hypothetical protein